MRYSQCGSCLKMFVTTEKQTMYCSLECEQQHDLFPRKNDINIKTMLAGYRPNGKLLNYLRSLEDKHKQHIELINNLGFLNVRLYEDVGEGAYYDAFTPHGRKVEVAIQDQSNKVLWRELHPKKVEWFEIDIETSESEADEDFVAASEQLTLAI